MAYIGKFFDEANLRWGSGAARNHVETKEAPEIEAVLLALGKVALPLTGHCSLRAGPDLQWCSVWDLTNKARLKIRVQS